MRDCLEGLSPVPLKQISLFETWENRIVQHKLFEYSGSFFPLWEKVSVSSAQHRTLWRTYRWIFRFVPVLRVLEAPSCLLSLEALNPIPHKDSRNLLLASQWDTTGFEPWQTQVQVSLATCYVIFDITLLCLNFSPIKFGQEEYS